MLQKSVSSSFPFSSYFMPLLFIFFISNEFYCQTTLIAKESMIVLSDDVLQSLRPMYSRYFVTHLTSIIYRNECHKSEWEESSRSKSERLCRELLYKEIFFLGLCWFNDGKRW